MTSQQGRPVHLADLPQLMAEWDYEKNQGASPGEIFFRSHKDFWWICVKGHSWQASPHNRAVGKGCPYCAGRKVLRGFNDLASMMPALMGEWDFERNTGLCPEEVTSSSGRKAWWVCGKGHRWEAVIASRTGGCGCPYCAGKLAWRGDNDLATVRPDLAREWDYDKNTDISPDVVTAGSATRVWWKCAKGHSWITSIANRARGTGCPVCTNRKIVIGENDLAFVRPDLIEEWDYEKNQDIRPYQVTPGSGRKVWWKCREGHSWKAPVSNRAIGQGCPYCINKHLWPGYNDLASCCPDLVAGWDYERNGDLTPERVTVSCGKDVWWKCQNGHSWQASPRDRSKGKGCPYCNGHRVMAGYNDILTLRPDLASEWDYDKNIVHDPARLSPGSNVVVWWICEKRHSWRASPDQRIRGSGCPYCANKKVLPGYNDLATLRPDIVSTWDYEKNGSLIPEKVTEKSRKRAFWICEQGHSWRSSIANRTSHGHGCPYCAGQKVLPGENDLLTLNPELASEWDFEKNHPLTPDMVMPHTAHKAWWKCTKGHSWQASIGSRHSNGCPYCSRRRPVSGENDLATVSPEIAAEWDYERNGKLRPDELLPMSNRKVWWKCEKGHSYRAAPSERQNGNACPKCRGHVKMRTMFIS